jgi:hypothetical protein
LRSRLRIILLGLLAFAIALAVVFPAGWLKGWLPAGMSCASLGGSVWRGECSTLVWSPPGRAPLRLDLLRWRLSPLALLRASAQAQVEVAGPGLAANGQVAVQSGGRVRLSQLSGHGRLDRSLLSALPSGWSTEVEARSLDLAIDGGQLQSLGGTLLARDLRDERGTALGNFRLDFPAQGAPPFTGSLRDEGGPMQLDSQLTINANRSWQLRGTVISRPGSPAALNRVLDQLANADINGRRSFTIEGSVR